MKTRFVLITAKDEPNIGVIKVKIPTIGIAEGR